MIAPNQEAEALRVYNVVRRSRGEDAAQDVMVKLLACKTEVKSVKAYVYALTRRAESRLGTLKAQAKRVGESLHESIGDNDQADPATLYASPEVLTDLLRKLRDPKILHDARRLAQWNLGRRGENSFNTRERARQVKNRLKQLLEVEG